MKLVLCEGEDDQAVIEGLIENSGMSGIAVEQYKGTPKLREYLRALPQRPEFTRREVASLGIVMDADTARASAWQRVKDCVGQAFDVELLREAEFVSDLPRIAGFITGVGDQGSLEDLCLEAVRSSAGFVCLDQYFQCLCRETGKTSFPGKARFRAWMASQSDFDLRVGLAARKGHLPWDNPAFDGLRAFLRAL